MSTNMEKVEKLLHELISAIYTRHIPPWQPERYGPERLALLKAIRSIAATEADKLDAQRYRFLRDDFSPMGLNIDGNHAWAYRRNATLKGPNLDAAIDAAMKEKPE